MKPTIYTAQELESTLVLPYETVVTALQQGVIRTEHGLMRFGSNYTFLVTVTHQETEFLAVYKPRSGERPLWDFPDGTLCNREVAAWEVSEALGWTLIPPTVLREDAPRGAGSVQVFIAHDPERHYFTFEEQHAPFVQQLALFDAISNNADRKGGHCLLDEAGRVWGIDQGLCFNVAYKLRTVIWDFAGQPIDPALLADLTRLCDQLDDKTSSLNTRLAPLLDASERQALHRRVQKLLSGKLYPLPGPGANRPWPPV